VPMLHGVVDGMQDAVRGDHGEVVSLLIKHGGQVCTQCVCVFGGGGAVGSLGGQVIWLDFSARL
jgi:hypothetical protein